MPDKNKDDILYQEMLANIVKEKGGSPEIYNNLLNKIGYLESGLNPSIKQKSGGPGRGKYQMETGIGYDKDPSGKVGHYKGTSNRIYYSAVRTKNYLKTLGKEVPNYIQNIIDNETGDASTLTESQQDILALGDLRMGPVNLKDYADGKISGKDIYINNWWAGKDPEYKAKLEKRWDDRDEEFKQTSHYQPIIDVEPLTKDKKFFPERQQVQIDNTRTKQLEMKEIDQSFAKGKFDDFLSKRMESLNQNNATSTQAQGTEMAQGGMLNHFKGGGTHEQNPMGGIPQGIGANGKLNTVEEDETSYNFPEGKFIFTNRIKI